MDFHLLLDSKLEYCTIMGVRLILESLKKLFSMNFASLDSMITLGS